jgi:hypothetical protein
MLRIAANLRRTPLPVENPGSSPTVASAASAPPPVTTPIIATAVSVPVSMAAALAMMVVAMMTATRLPIIRQCRRAKHRRDQRRRRRGEATEFLQEFAPLPLRRSHAGGCCALSHELSAPLRSCAALYCRNPTSYFVPGNHCSLIRKFRGGFESRLGETRCSARINPRPTHDKDVPRTRPGAPTPPLIGQHASLLMLAMASWNVDHRLLPSRLRRASQRHPLQASFSIGAAIARGGAPPP